MSNMHPHNASLPVAAQSSPSLSSLPHLPPLLRTRDGAIIEPQKNIHAFVANELDVSRLNEMVDRSLWLAGRIGNIRPLHRQRLLGRRIVVSEQMDLHLLWKDEIIYIKPLPVWLLDEDFFRQHIASDRDLLATANGFLMSFALLINYRSDFHIARADNLVPEDMDWQDWRNLISNKLVKLISDIEAGTAPCAQRFQFGELRLGRVNRIYRFHPAYRLQHAIRGYHYGNQTYSSFLRRNFTWLIAVFAYITIVLTAMQVGLGTTELRSSAIFDRASYGFTIFSIVLPLAAFGFGIALSLVLTVYHVHTTRQHLRNSTSKFTPGKV